MILELNGTKVTIVDKTLGYQGDNLVDTIQVTVDKDSTWNYKLDMYKGKSKCFDSVLMTREGNVCTVQLTNEILSYGGRYIFQLRGYTDTQTYHSDIFESWVNTSIEYQYDCKQTDCGCDCKLPTEFYQVEDNVTEINNHPPYPSDNGKWMIWDVNKHQYVESDIDVIGGSGDYQTKDNLTTSITAASTDEQYPSAKATYDYGQSIAKSAGKIDAITVNDVEQTIDNKTAKIVVDKTTVGLSNVDNTSDADKPVSLAQETAIADAKKAGTDAQANLTAHINNKENPHKVTKGQIGLGEVDNTSDINKPISTAQATAIADAKKAGTDAQTNLTAHINDKENPHEVSKAQVGLGNVDNTSDVNKPISTATQTALNGKLDKTAVVDVTAEALKGQAADAKSVYDTIQALPTGTDISLGLTGASVGDIIKVKAVDSTGKPTEWEAANDGGNQPYKILYSQTLTEKAAVSVSMSAEAVACNEYILSVAAPKGDAKIAYSKFSVFFGYTDMANNKVVVHDTYGKVTEVRGSKSADGGIYFEYFEAETASLTPNFHDVVRTGWNNSIRFHISKQQDAPNYLFKSLVELPAGTIILITGR